MSQYDCDTMRDLLPALVRGDLLPHETASARLHLDGCVECADEAALVRLLQESLESVPSGLEARVLLAVRAVPSALPQRRWMPTRLAMAATVAAAVLGGSLVFDRISLAPRGDSTMASSFVADASEMSWAAAEDPMLHGVSRLHELTVEELEILLAELDS